MNETFATGLFATLIVSCLMALVALIARRLEKHLDKQDGRLERIERVLTAVRVRLHMEDMSDLFSSK